jgi:putative sigma-54 modulation protein
MKIRIRQRNVQVPVGLQSHVERRLGFALSRFGAEIGIVTVHLSNADGTHGGGGDHCHIEVALRPKTVSVMDTDKDLFAAVNHASQRMARTVARALDRSRREHE